MRVLNAPAALHTSLAPDAGHLMHGSATHVGENGGRVLLQARGLSKRFGGVNALDGVSLRLRASEFVALLGPNGAGKTTLFNILTGLLRADAGAVRILGRSMRQQSWRRQAALGIVFQQPAIDLEMTVRQNLRFHARLYGVPTRKRRQRIEKALHAVGLIEDADRRVRELSGGNRRRVELARATLHEPRVLLLDEPSTALDPAGRRDLLARVAALQEQTGAGVLWATQLVEEAEHADRVIILDRGRVVSNMPPADLRARLRCETLLDAFLAITATPGEMSS